MGYSGVEAFQIKSGSALVDEGGVTRTVQATFVSASGIGATLVVAAQGAGVRIRLLAAIVTPTLAVTVKFQSAANDITAGHPLAANAAMVWPYCPHGWCQTNANEALNVNLGVATATGVHVIWMPAA